MELLSDDELLRQIEPDLEQAHRDHMASTHAELLYPAEVLSGVAQRYDPAIQVDLDSDPARAYEPDESEIFPTIKGDPTADPLDYGPVLRESLVTHIHETEANQLDIRPLIGSGYLIGLLTEENLPYYVKENGRMAEKLEALYGWLRQWTREEKGHGLVMNEYATLTGIVGKLVSHKRYKAGVDSQMKGGMNIEVASPAQGFAYLALQEYATFESHKNVSWLLDSLGKRVLNRIGGQEFNHSELYQKLLGALLRVDPDRTIVAIRDQYIPENFRMPGGSIPGFKSLSANLAIAGVLDGYTLNKLKAKIVGKLKITDLQFNTDEAKQAQADLVGWLDDETCKELGGVAMLDKHREKRIKAAKESGKLLPVIFGRTVQIPSSKNPKKPSDITTNAGLIITAA